MLHSPIGRAFETLLFQTPRSDYLQPSPTPTFLPYGDVDEARLPDIQGSSRLKMVETPHTSGSSRTISRTRQARELNCSTAIKAGPNTSVLGQCMTIAYTKVQNNKEGFKMLKSTLSCLRRNQKWMLYIQIPVQNGKDPEAEYEVLTELWGRFIEYGIEERNIGDLVAVDVDRYAERKKTSKVGSSSSRPKTKRTKPSLSRVSRIHPQQCSVVLPTVEKLTLRGSFRNFFPFPINTRKTSNSNVPLTLWGINFASLTTLILDSDLLVDECTRIFRSCVNLETLAFRLNDELPFVQYNLVRMDKLKKVVIATESGEAIEKFLRRLDAPVEYMELCVGKGAVKRLAKKEANHMLRKWVGAGRVVIRCPREFVPAVRASIPAGVKNVEFREYRGLDLTMVLDPDFDERRC